MLLISILVFSMMTSYEKDAAPQKVPGPRIEGLWIGKYTVNGAAASSYYSFVIKPNGTLIVDSKAGTEQHVSLGTWNLSGTTLTCNYTCIYGSPGSINLVQSSTATWDKLQRLSGTWQNVNGVTAAGTLKLTKVK